MAVQTSDGHVVGSYYAASGDAAGTLEHAPRVLCPSGWVCAWETIFCIDGTLVVAVEARPSTRHSATQTTAPLPQTFTTTDVGDTTTGSGSGSSSGGGGETGDNLTEGMMRLSTSTLGRTTTTTTTATSTLSSSAYFS